MTLYEAIEFVVAHGNTYAKSYARQAQMQWDAFDDDELHTQVLYIKSNFSGCRAPGAKEARQKMATFLKG